VNISETTLTIRATLFGRFLSNGQAFSIPLGDNDVAAGVFVMDL